MLHNCDNDISEVGSITDITHLSRFFLASEPLGNDITARRDDRLQMASVDITAEKKYPARLQTRRTVSTSSPSGIAVAQRRHQGNTPAILLSLSLGYVGLTFQQTLTAGR